MFLFTTEKRELVRGVLNLIVLTLKVGGETLFFNLGSTEYSVYFTVHQHCSECVVFGK